MEQKCEHSIQDKVLKDGEMSCDECDAVITRPDPVESLYQKGHKNLTEWDVHPYAIMHINNLVEWALSIEKERDDWKGRAEEAERGRSGI